MRTKLILTIEIDEQLEDTENLLVDLLNKGECQIKDVFDPEMKIIVSAIPNSVHAVKTDHLGRPLESPPKPTEINFIMYTRNRK